MLKKYVYLILQLYLIFKQPKISFITYKKIVEFFSIQANYVSRFSWINHPLNWIKLSWVWGEIFKCLWTKYLRFEKKITKSKTLLSLWRLVAFVYAVIAFVANEPLACNGRLQRAMCSVAAKGRLFAMGRVLFRCSKMMLYTSSPIFFKKNCYFSCEKNMNLELRWDLLVRWCCLYDTSSLFLLRKKLTWDFEEKMIL